MKRNLLILLFVVAAVLILMIGAMVYGRLSSMSAMHVEERAQTLGPLPMNKTGASMIAPNMPFRIDFGSSVNTINDEYLRRLEKMGMQVDSSRVLTYVITSLGKRRLATKRYRVSLPVYVYSFDSDSTGITYQLDTLNRVNTIHCVDFVKVGQPSEMPRLGMPFFKKFLVEYDHDLKALRFHSEMPEDYEEMGGMSKEKAFLSEPRAYLLLGVDNDEHEFFINSSMPRAGLLFPKAEAPYVDNIKTYSDTIPSVYGDIPVVINYDSWVEWGDRAGKNVSYFADYGGVPYAVNPFNFLTQDALFDFKNSKVYLHPYSGKYKRLRSNDEFRK